MNDSLFSHCREVWSVLPPALRKALLLGGDAGPRLLLLAEELMEHLGDSAHAQILTGIFTDMASFAWESSFFDPHAASIVHQIEGQLRFLPPQAKVFAGLCAAARPADTEVARHFEDVFEVGDTDTLKVLLDERRRVEAGNLFWYRFARYVGLLRGESDWYEGWLTPQGLPPAFSLALKGEYLFAREDWVGAESLFAAAYAEAPLVDFLVKQGECLHRQGQAEAAARCWALGAEKRPWQINLLLRLTDTLRGRDVPKGPPPGKGKILLYSWNHADDLEATLTALAASDLGGCGILALDNGSADATPSILRAWKERLGDALETVTLPTNVGAPAARNWLLCLDDTRRADWVVFLDDDALVPPDWLGWFGAALREYPKAEIVGCRVVEKAAPLTLQSVDLHFDAGSKAADEGRAERHFAAGSVLVPHALDTVDFGRFSYLRPAMSVTGCCHLLTRKSLDETGLFDLRFSPSQFDDFERDLRSAAKGKLCVYQGHLRVRHIKRSGSAVGISSWQQANIGGNLFKLWNTYSAETVEDLIEADSRALWQDLQERLGENRG